MTKPDPRHSAGRAGAVLRRVLPAGLTGLAGTACAACCVIGVAIIMYAPRNA